MKSTAMILSAALQCAAATAALAQGSAPPGGTLEKATPPAAPAKAPATSAPAAATNVPAAANAPAAATGTPAPAAAPAAGSKVTVVVPSGGEYTAYVQEATTGGPQTFSDKVTLEIPTGLKQATVYVLDNKSGYAARKTLTAGAIPAELPFAGPDFKLVQKVRITITGKDDKPIAGAMVSLTDSNKLATRKVLQAADAGVAEFDFVPSGTGSVAVIPKNGSATTKDINVGLPVNEQVQVVTIALPEVTDVVEPVTAPGTTAAPAANTPAAAPTAATPTAAPPTAAPQQLPAPASGGWASNLIGWIFLIALIGGGYLYLKRRGITSQQVLGTLGVQPDTVVAGGGSLAGANLAGSAPSPGAAPAPPPIVADPNQCPFCGQMKDPSGGCACTVTPGMRAAGAAPAFGGASGPAGSGPRLVGVAGAYMGHVYPLSGSAVLGREATNSIPLDRDTTASRRHAQVTDVGGSFRVQDLGSSNGTFLNGAKVTDAPLQPGDEVTVGGTRFRFEV